jgi:hypothetical protein
LRKRRGSRRSCRGNLKRSLRGIERSSNSESARKERRQRTRSNGRGCRISNLWSNTSNSSRRHHPRREVVESMITTLGLMRMQRKKHLQEVRRKRVVKIDQKCPFIRASSLKSSPSHLRANFRVCERLSRNRTLNSSSKYLS